MSYLILAYYCFTPIEDPEIEVRKHKKFFQNLDVAGRIYLSKEGINGQMSGAEKDAEAYIAWLRSDPRFANMTFKIHHHHENIFARMTVKCRSQLVALDYKVDLSKGGQHLSPKEWKEMLEQHPDVLLLDVRNQYEWVIGHFEGATCPPLDNFRDFLHYAEHLKDNVNKAGTKVMMYCTGGIRCELYSAVLKEKGFDEVYQLEGGLLNYGLQEGDAHWKGKVFVFDDRLAVAIDGQECEPISRCSHCHLPNDTYYNCANMDCNALFLCCDSCIETYSGCCCHACKQAPRVRLFNKERGNKPFRRKHLIDSETFSCATCESAEG